MTNLELDFDYDDFSRDLEETIENDINSIKTIDDFERVLDDYTSTLDEAFSLWFDDDDDLDLDETGSFKE